MDETKLGPDLLKNSFCARPWTHLVQDTSGHLSPCCKIDDRLRFQGQPTRSLSEAWRGEDMEELRKKFLAGKKPEECHQCWRDEASGRVSDRQAWLKGVSHFLGDPSEFLKNMESRVSTEPPLPPISLDLKLTNLCNLKCRICSPSFSSKMAKELVKVGFEEYRSNLVSEETGLANTNLNMETFAEWLPHLRQIDLFGGEPLLMPDHRKILEMCVQHGHSSKISIRYNSNGTVGPEKFIEYWPHFKEVKFYLSIDDVGQRFEYQRKGASWPKVIENTYRFKQLQLKNFETRIFITYSILNIYYLLEILDWANDVDLPVYLNPLHLPPHLSIRNMPHLLKEAIWKRLSTPSHFSKKIHPHTPFCSIKNFLFNEEPEWDPWKRFFIRTRAFDKIRNESFEDVFPELCELMKELDVWIPRESTEDECPVSLKNRPQDPQQQPRRAPEAIRTISVV